jgi:hypothetical protein
MTLLAYFGATILIALVLSAAAITGFLLFVTYYGYKLSRLKSEDIDSQAILFVTLIQSKPIEFRHKSLLKAWEICVKPELVAESANLAAGVEKACLGTPLKGEVN